MNYKEAVDKTILLLIQLAVVILIVAGLATLVISEPILSAIIAGFSLTILALAYVVMKVSNYKENKKGNK
jgi:hypothetical protein